MSDEPSKDPLVPGASELGDLPRALDGHPIATFVLDLEHRVVCWNRACEHLTAVPRERVLGRPVDSKIFYDGPRRPVLAELMLDGNVSAIQRLYGRKKLERSAIIPGAYEAVAELHIAGVRRTVYFLAAIIHDRAGQPVGAIETLQDITERVAAEEQLERYRRRLQQLATRLSLAEERERHRLAQVLHDDVGQMLFAIKTKAAVVQMLDQDPQRRELLGQLLAMIDETIDHSRELTFELCPPLLYEMGLRRALEALAEQFQTRFGLTCVVDGQGTVGDPDTRGLAFQCTRELLMNVVKHAGATEARAHLGQRQDSREVTVSDNGRGFDPRAADRRTSTFGLFNIRERLSVVGGALEIRSGQGGTAVTLRIPGAARAGRGGP